MQPERDSLLTYNNMIQKLQDNVQFFNTFKVMVNNVNFDNSLSNSLKSLLQKIIKNQVPSENKSEYKYVTQYVDSSDFITQLNFIFLFTSNIDGLPSPHIETEEYDFINRKFQIPTYQSVERELTFTFIELEGLLIYQLFTTYLLQIFDYYNGYLKLNDRSQYTFDLSVYGQYKDTFFGNDVDQYLIINFYNVFPVSVKFGSELQLDNTSYATTTVTFKYDYYEQI